MSELDDFENFLSALDLAKYRKKYVPIKTVELDLPRRVQSIPQIFKCYWERKSHWVSFEEFYEIYLKGQSLEIENFRKESFFSKKTFYTGLPARTYRTWASLLTQIQGGYLAQKIFGRGSVNMNAELDWRGIDFEITRAGSVTNVQVKKDTVRKEAYGPDFVTKGRNRVQVAVIRYNVPGKRYKQNGIDERKPFQDWKKEWQGKLDILPNGFVVFRKKIFDGI